LVLGSSAALAQPYGNGRNGNGPGPDRRYEQDYQRCYAGPYGPSECATLRQRPDFEQYRQRYQANIVSYILDPATGRPVTQKEYMARYPYSNPVNWAYDQNTNLWVDNNPPQQNPKN